MDFWNLSQMALECCVLSCILRHPDLQFIQNFKWFKIRRSIVRKAELYVGFKRHWFSIIKHKWFNTHSGISWEMRILLGFDWMPGNLPLKTSLLLAAEIPKTIDSRRCINFAQTDALFKFHSLQSFSRYKIYIDHGFEARIYYFIPSNWF